MAEDDNKSEERKFSQEQYDMLKRCSKAEDMSEWNEWRKNNQDVDIELEGISRAKFYGWYLEKVWLHAYPNKSGKVYLRQADFQYANLRGASFRDAHLEGALFGCAEIQNADFDNAHLENTTFAPSNLKGTHFMKSHLEDAVFRGVVLDGETIFWDCTISKCVSSVVRGTDFTGSQLNAVRINPGTKQLLEYNIRRMNWEDWYKEHKFLRGLVKWFWSLSDYGISTSRVLKAFGLFAVLFALIYYAWGAIDCYCFKTPSPGIVYELFEFDGKALPWWEIPFRSVYFSIVTMTTLGFGDMHANADNTFAIVGYLFLTVQVLLGYVMLGALVTRFAVLFQAGGPASFTKISKTDEKKTNKK